eukprot:scaffold91732_cov27-Phaeocystis_antarctica.AAC.1
MRWLVGAAAAVAVPLSDVSPVRGSTHSSSSGGAAAEARAAPPPDCASCARHAASARRLCACASRPAAEWARCSRSARRSSTVCSAAAQSAVACRGSGTGLRGWAQVLGSGAGLRGWAQGLGSGAGGHPVALRCGPDRAELGPELADCRCRPVRRKGGGDGSFWRCERGGLKGRGRLWTMNHLRRNTLTCLLTFDEAVDQSAFELEPVRRWPLCAAEATAATEEPPPEARVQRGVTGEVSLSLGDRSGDEPRGIRACGRSRG